MKRDSKLLKRRVKMIGLFFEIKKSQGLPSKVAAIEIAEALTISATTIKNDLAKFHRECRVI